MPRSMSWLIGSYHDRYTVEPSDDTATSGCCPPTVSSVSIEMIDFSSVVESSSTVLCVRSNHVIYTVPLSSTATPVVRAVVSEGGGPDSPTVETDQAPSADAADARCTSLP